METVYDVVIAGLGAMGSAAAYHLSRRGMSVLGLDRYHPPHAFGSSHGLSRIIREAYYESPLYVPLVQRAYENWRTLEEEYQMPLLHQTGGLMIGYPKGFLVSGSRRSAEIHNLPFEMLTAKQIQEQYPVLHPKEDQVAVKEVRAGILRPEECIHAFLQQAEKAGAHLRFEEAVESWEAWEKEVCVRTNQGRYRARKAILCTGAWLRQLQNEVDLPLKVERQVSFWFEPKEEAEGIAMDRLPVIAWEFKIGLLFYLIPNLGEGIKVAIHHGGALADPDRLDREVKEEEIEQVRTLLKRYLPSANGRLLYHQACMYTNSPDHHFILDTYPGESKVYLLSACSGHGFKFASVLGEVMADLVTRGKTSFDISLFRLDRLMEK